jgi:hypothetical protein
LVIEYFIYLRIEIPNYYKYKKIYNTLLSNGLKSNFSILGKFSQNEKERKLYYNQLNNN